MATRDASEGRQSNREPAGASRCCVEQVPLCWPSFVVACRWRCRARTHTPCSASWRQQPTARCDDPLPYPLSCLQIRKAYRTLALKYHPDKDPSPEAGKSNQLLSPSSPPQRYCSRKSSRRTTYSRIRRQRSLTSNTYLLSTCFTTQLLRYATGCARQRPQGKAGIADPRPEAQR